jgi:hypothetical protein
MEGDGSAGPAVKGSGGAGAEKGKGKKAAEKRKAEPILCPYPVKVPSLNVPEVCGRVTLSTRNPEPCQGPKLDVPEDFGLVSLSPHNSKP